MKTTKRKRSSAAKVTPSVDASSVDAVIADTQGSVPASGSASEPTSAVVEAVAVATGPASAGEPIIVLAANCSVKDAAALKDSLCLVANESAVVAFDTSAVERIDTATIQLLCAFVRDRAGRNQRVTWTGESEAVRDAARLLGVRALLGLDEANGVAA